MSNLLAWLALLLTAAVVLAYEVMLMVMQRRHPEQLARSAHANLRQEWFAAVSAQNGSEILAAPVFCTAGRCGT